MTVQDLELVHWANATRNKKVFMIAEGRVFYSGGPTRNLEASSGRHRARWMGSRILN